MCCDTITRSEFILRLLNDVSTVDVTIGIVSSATAQRGPGPPSDRG